MPGRPPTAIFRPTIDRRLTKPGRGLREIAESYHVPDDSGRPDPFPQRVEVDEPEADPSGREAAAGMTTPASPSTDVRGGLLRA
jgi:hypothetical protein